MTYPATEHLEKHSHAARARMSNLVNDVTVIIGTAQVVCRAEERGRPLEPAPRMERIEAAARRVLHMLNDPTDTAEPELQEH
jgi:hypothetical protein